MVRRVSKGLGLRKVESQEGTATPGHDEGRELHNRKGKELPWNPQVHENALEGMRIGLEEIPLLPARFTPSEVRVSLCSGLMAQLRHYVLGSRFFRVFDSRRWDLFLRPRRRSLSVRRYVLHHFIRVKTMPLGLWKRDDDHYQRRGGHSCVQPPKFLPSKVQYHGTRNDRRNHQRSHIEHPVQRVPKSSVVQEEYVGDNSGLKGLRRTGTDAIKHGGSHEATVGSRFCTPNSRAKTDELGDNVDRPAAKRGADWNPITLC